MIVIVIVVVSLLSSRRVAAVVIVAVVTAAAIVDAVLVIVIAIVTAITVADVNAGILVIIHRLRHRRLCPLLSRRHLYRRANACLIAPLSHSGCLSLSSFRRRHHCQEGSQGTQKGIPDFK